MGRVLAIDYGLRRVGLAISDPLRMIANALPTVGNKALFTFLQMYCNKESVWMFLVGYPIDLHAHLTMMTVEVERLIKQLQVAFPLIAIRKMDERLTSKIAKDTILQSGIGKKKRQSKERIDKISAMILLQDFLSKTQINTAQNHFFIR